MSMLIAPFQTGLVRDVANWLAPSDGFLELDNAHVHHGKIFKRQGFRKLGDFPHGRTITGFTSANPALVTVASATGLANGQTVSLHYLTSAGVGTDFSTLNGGSYTISNLVGTSFNLLDSGGSQLDTSAFNTWASGILGTYPGNRIMGLGRFITADAAKVLLAWDTERAATYNTSLEVFEPLDVADIMAGTELAYVVPMNWQASGGSNRIYFTNGLALAGGVNGIWYYDGTSNSTTSFAPTVDGANNLNGAKYIFSVKQRFIALHTFEGASEYPQRVRWCSPQRPDRWDEVTYATAGRIDAPTGEQIVAAQPLRDSIIVYFTESVWVLTSTSDPTIPFRWVRLNSFRACDGKMATVGFDRYSVALSSRGITATDVSETRRVDDKIQTFVNNEVNAEYFGKVYGARSYEDQRTWVLYPSGTDTECNKALIYDEDSGAYSTYTISMNVLGYGNAAKDYTFADFVAANNLDITFAQGQSNTFQDYFFQKDSEIFLGGDINGSIYVMETDSSDDQVDIKATLRTVAWNPTKDQGTESRMKFIDILVGTDPVATFTIEFFKNDDLNPYRQQEFDALPNLGLLAVITSIDRTNPCLVDAPDHGLSTGDQVYIYGAYGMLAINGGPYTVTVLNSNSVTLDGVDATGYDAYSTGAAFYQREFYRDKVWKRAYAGGIGYQHSVRIVQDDKNAWVIEGFKPSFDAVGTRTTG